MRWKRRSNAGRLTDVWNYVLLHATGVASALVVLAFAAMPRAAAFNGLYRCPFKAFLGVPCPGCGLTRSLWLAFHGEFARSVVMHPLGIALGAMFCLWTADLFINARAWRTAVVRSQGVAAVFLAVAWVLRMAAAWSSG